MSNIPENLNYTEEHEWTLIENGVATIGITDFAQSSLGDIVFVELPEVGRVLAKNEAFGVVESIKSVSDLYAPLSGEVLEINEALVDTPEQCNKDSYGSWMVKIKLANESETSALMNANAYKEHCEAQ